MKSHELDFVHQSGLHRFNHTAAHSAAQFPGQYSIIKAKTDTNLGFIFVQVESIRMTLLSL
jgi:hypothetical protein